MRRKVLKWVGVGFVSALVLIQLVPYGRSHANPPVKQEPAWDSPTTRELVVRACFDCHSNETRWPWYSNVAPVSWLIQRDVDKGRREVNFSELDREQRAASEAGEEVQKGAMPQWYYVLLHSEAKLTPAEKDALVASLQKMFPERPRRRG
ncbi:MAG: heme-binding domain-containing protein [Chloroflexota bacterium]